MGSGARGSDRSGCLDRAGQTARTLAPDLPTRTRHCPDPDGIKLCAACPAYSEILYPRIAWPILAHTEIIHLAHPAEQFSAHENRGNQLPDPDATVFHPARVPHRTGTALVSATRSSGNRSARVAGCDMGHGIAGCVGDPRNHPRTGSRVDLPGPPSRTSSHRSPPGWQMARPSARQCGQPTQSIAHFLATLGWTWANWLIKLLTLAWVLSHVAQLGLAAALAGAIGGDLTTVLPIHAPGGFGTFEAGVVLALQPFGLDATSALAAAVNLHLFVLGSSLLAALMVLLIKVPGQTGQEREPRQDF